MQQVFERQSLTATKMTGTHAIFAASMGKYPKAWSFRNFISLHDFDTDSD